MCLKPSCQSIPVIFLRLVISSILRCCLQNSAEKVLWESTYKYLRQSNKVASYLSTIILRCWLHTNPNILLLAKRFQPHFYLEKLEQTFFSKKLTLASGAHTWFFPRTHLFPLLHNPAFHSINQVFLRQNYFLQQKNSCCHNSCRMYLNTLYILHSVVTET